MANFIWGGSHEHKKFHLFKLSKITLPKVMGGWGILDLCRFGWALLIKSLWRGIFGTGTWSLVIKQKYLKKHDFIYWFWRGSIGVTNGLALWLIFEKVTKIILQHLAWNIGSSHNILIGIDHILGAGNEDMIPEQLIHTLNRRGIYFWCQAISLWRGPYPVWKSAQELGLSGHWDLEWDQIVAGMKQLEICRAGIHDKLI